ncbi:MAG: helix-turn-helix domain-containing protein [Muribaculaceae bacterium]|nr:helix-turn-helix domain-containing protein [Muribaculaceae bacterium]
MFDEATHSFDNIYSLGSDTHVQEVTSLMTDRRGMLWISTLGSGAICMSRTGDGLQLDKLDNVRTTVGSNNVRCLLIASDGTYWIGIGSNKGLVKYNPATGETDTLNPHDRFAASYRSPISVYSLFEMPDGKIMIGTYDAGLYIVSPHTHIVEHYTKENSPFIGGDRVSDIFRDSRGRYWFGGLPGLGVRLPDGSGCTFDTTELRDAEIADITEGDNGSIWVATQNLGLFRIDGSGNDTDNYSIHQYNPARGNANSSDISVVYSDPQGRLWMGSNGAGLSLYDYTGDRFDCVHLKWNLPGDIISGILSDAKGTLWISTNTGLFSMTPPDSKSDRASYRLYTKGDGVQDNVFNRGAVARDNRERLYFAGPRGINIIDGKESHASARPLPVSITDISISGHHWNDLDAATRRAISTEAPSMTSELTLKQSQNNFNVEFAVIDFANDPMQHRYAYMLEGFDKQWNSVDCTHRFAAYSNLPSGEYTLRIKSMDSSGNHTGTERVLMVTILPPWWASWQAMLLYAALLATGALSIWHTRRSRRRKAALDIAKPSKETDETGADDNDTNAQSPDEQFLRRATACVMAHLSDTEFSQTTFTEEMGISKSTLFRKLKAITGMTYSSFVRSIRLNTACKLMKEKRGIRISELAYSVGFNDPKYFSQCFRKEFGLTPGEYMENLTDETSETPSKP